MHQAVSYLSPLSERDEVGHSQSYSHSPAPPFSPSPRVEMLLEEICRNFCLVQEQQLREVTASLKQALLLDVERPPREGRPSRRSSSHGHSRPPPLMMTAASSRAGATLHLSPRSPRSPASPKALVPPIEALKQKQAQQHHLYLPEQEDMERQPQPKAAGLADTLQQRAAPDLPQHEASVSKLDVVGVQTLRVPLEVRASLQRHSLRSGTPHERVCTFAERSSIYDQPADQVQAIVEVGHSQSAPSPRTFRPSRDDRVPTSAFAWHLRSTREAFEDTWNKSGISRFYRGITTASNDSSSRGQKTLSGSSGSLGFFQSASGMLGSVGSMFFAGPPPDPENIEEAHALPKTEAQRKAARRLRAVFGHGSNHGVVPKDVLSRVLMRRMAISEAAADSIVAAFVPELYEIHDKLQSLHLKQPPGVRERSGSVVAENPEKHNEGPIQSEHSKISTSFPDVEGVPLDLLADIISLPDPSVYTFGATKKIIAEVAEALLNFTTEEAIDEATKSGAIALSWNHLKDGAPWETRLNAFVSVVIFINLGSAGISVDHWVGNIGWVILETFCTLVMVAEVLIKTYKWGYKTYFCGEQRYWNWLDLFITLLGIVDVSFTIMNYFIETRGVSDGPSLKITVAFRALRMARIVRTVKVVNNPFIKDLAKMVIGFVIGLPQLIWVMVMFSGILYLTGLFFRLTFGPESPADRISDLCPNPDDIDSTSDPLCEADALYGEEFFSTVQVSMFTCFRFMLGDFSTRGGKNLVVAMSESHGYWFNGLFGIWMIVVIFGVFNIISAIFVDATITGLKHNEVKKKYVEQYEKRFVREKLTELMERIRLLCEFSGSNNGDCSLSSSGSVGPNDSILLYEAEFIDVMNDPVVKSYLQDLDIVMHNPADLFDTFDPHGRGRVTGPEMVEAFVKLRGEPQKNDLVAAWLSLRGLHEKVDELRLCVAHQQLHMEVQTHQTQMWHEKSGSIPPV